MHRLTIPLAGSLVMLGLSVPATAAITGVDGPVSALGPGSIPRNPGIAAVIIAAPADVTDNAAHNLGMQGFDERQGVRLETGIQVDGGFIEAGTLVDSHMIFLNTGPGFDPFPASHAGVVWTFSGRILGVMSDLFGNEELATSPRLGAPGTTYPSAPQKARGLESQEGGDARYPQDGYTIVGANRIRVAMSVTEPGDWIRVITEAVPKVTWVAPVR